MEQLSLLLRQQLRHRGTVCACCSHRIITPNPPLPATTTPATATRRRHVHSTPAPGRQAATGPAQKKQNDDINRGTSDDFRQAHSLQGYYLDILSPTYRSHPARRTRSLLPEERKAQEQPPPTTPESEAQSQPQPSLSDAQSPAEKMSIVFGTRLAGPGYSPHANASGRYDPGSRAPESTWRTVNGVPIPPRPLEPDNCCMSGCVHCVWDDFRDEVEAWAERVREARKRRKKEEAVAQGKEGRKGKKAKGKGRKEDVVLGDMRQNPRKEVQSAAMSMDDDGGGSETNWSLEEVKAGAGEEEEDLFVGIPVGIREFMKTEKKLKEKKRAGEGGKSKSTASQTV
ncbi:hypothetical protein AJ79_03581 [Helicocarpus griseus UAMH5409]|uniref:Oxidoreductase-like domain-containing protein n=1 Tax=Helicocarpus griseus UAMH5409 TaxID=1447875 RepID=A0A2B7XYE0_9EURO|nr:hypothetical protein AJ79_03581 [Helicocarpus griseus UAMH5409]